MPQNDLPNIAATPPSRLPEAPRALDAAEVLAAWRAGKKPITLDSYARDLADFAAWCRETPAGATAKFLSLDAGMANGAALGYLEHLRERGLASATVNRRIAALRSLVKAARLIGMVNWNLELPTPKVTPYRDTRGPGRGGFMRLVRKANASPEPRRSRDLALLWLMYGRALRRSEAAGIALPDDLDLAGERVRIRGKHRDEPEWVTIPPAACRAVADWLLVRGSEPGPLFYRLDFAANTLDRRPLTGRGIQWVVGNLGDAAGIRARPHGLRHAGITEVLDVTKGDHRAAQKFGRLKTANVLAYYDDNREDKGGEAAKLIAP
jgi:integrase/recombinase XerC